MIFFPKTASLDDKIQIVIILLLKLSLIVAMVSSLISGSWDFLITSVLALLFSFVPNRIGQNYKIRLPIEFELIAVIFIYASIIGGFAFDGYSRLWWWDDLLHTASGVVLGFAGFVVLYTNYYTGKLQLKAWFMAFLTVAIAVTLGVAWEIFEFIADQYGATMQPSLEDTMYDLIVDVLGALIIALPGYYYLKHRSEGVLARLIKNYLNNNPHLRPKA